jgi:hypothetical protein
VAYYTKDGIAIAIIHEGKRRGITQKGIQIAIATGLVESNLTMYANQGDPESLTFPYDAMGSDYNSVGVFQQRAEWWGTCAQRMDPAQSAGLFYDSLVNQRIGDQDYNTDATTPGGWADMVQRSAYPARYDERYPEAQDYYARLKDAPCPAEPGNCGDGGAPPDGEGGGELVGEVVLPYDSSVVPQETYWDCGPAAAQIVLNGHGIIVSEMDLVNQIGTHEGGTDSIDQITPVMKKYLPDGQYATTWLQQDPPTQQQKDKLWADLTNSINGGYGLVMNWVAPPANYPRGIKGSTSPSYGGGVVYHYVSCMGYDDNPSQRACWIADSGFNPFEYWCSFDQVATLIPPKGYLCAMAPSGVPTPTPPTPTPVPPEPGPAGPGLTQEEHDKLLAVWDAIYGKRVSLSEYKPPSEGAIWAAADLWWNDDGMVHTMFIEHRAMIGDQSAIALIQQQVDAGNEWAAHVYSLIPEQYKPTQSITSKFPRTPPR